MHEILIEFGYQNLIKDPNRPGPNYYDDCIEFNWIDHIVNKHKKHLKRNGLSLELYEEEERKEKALRKLT